LDPCWDQLFHVGLIQNRALQVRLFLQRPGEHAGPASANIQEMVMRGKNQRHLPGCATKFTTMPPSSLAKIP
jgi:hypothetical protein